MIILIVAGVFITVVSLPLLIRRYRRYHQQKRLDRIDDYRFHPAILRKVHKRYPHLQEDQLVLVETALRDYFKMCLLAGRRAVAMPSQAVDVAWHEFILFTRSYEEFCQQNFGRFLHHTPTEAMTNAAETVPDSIRRAWRLACALNEQHPAITHPTPLIFALDLQLAIPDGFRYLPNCKQNPDAQGQYSSNSYCTSDIHCSSGCHGDSWDNSERNSGFGDHGSSGDNGGSGCSGDSSGGCSGGGD